VGATVTRSIAVSHAALSATFLVPVTIALLVVGLAKKSVGSVGSPSVFGWTALGCTPLAAAGLWFLWLSISAARRARAGAPLIPPAPSRRA